MTAFEIGLLSSLVFVGFFVQTITGFGAVLFGLTLGAFHFRVATLVPILIGVSTVSNAYLVQRYWREVDRPRLTRQVIPWMGAGAVIGFVVSPLLMDAGFARPLLGVFVVCASARGFFVAARGRQESPLGRLSAAFWLVVSGLMQAIYGSGGPPLVYVLNRAGMSKNGLRATLCAVWLAINVGLIAAMVAAGRWTPLHSIGLAVALPSAALALVAGERAFHRLDADRVRVAILGLLGFAGLVLLATG